ncbi:MAG: hypothetical protein FJX00_03135 [Alphaproteobacteria bacterium]|nr:hypothetical protein [Alphaproteobacteria bacterium]
MSSKKQFIQALLWVALWSFPAFFSVFGTKSEEQPQNRINDTKRKSINDIKRTEYLLELIDKIEQMDRDYVGMKLDYLCDECPERKIIQRARKNRIPICRATLGNEG